MTYKALFPICAVSLLLLSACGGGGGGSSSSTNGGPLSGNWQWTTSTPAAQGGLTGGFILQNGNAVTGSLAYSTFPTVGNTTAACAGGSAPVTGTLNGQNVTLTAVAGAQTFTFTGTLTSNGLTMSGTYTSTAGPALPGGGSCGTAQKGASWSATSVPPLTGDFQGSFHSVTGQSFSGDAFAVMGNLMQGQNIGADHATVTGTLTISGYPCFTQASLNGTISGTSVILNIFAENGLQAGQIGSSPSTGGSPPSPAVFRNAARGSGMVLLGSGLSGYTVTTKACPEQQGIHPGDAGNVCFGLGTATGCDEPISLTPNIITFPPQVLGTPPTTQTITLTNTDPLGSTQDLSLSFTSDLGDFNQQPDFIEQDTCGPSPFALEPNQNCTILITFVPQESCPLDPTLVPPVQCPSTLKATLTVTSPISVDGNAGFQATITGTGVSAIVPSTGELDFSGEAIGEASEPQSITFVNQGLSPVQILPPGQCVYPVPNPLISGPAGLQVVDFAGGVCDSSPPNFSIKVDGCSGRLLQPQEPCTVIISYTPQPGGFLTEFLELNTLQCAGGTTMDCEIDAGRFPVELNANAHTGPIRLIPAASLTFPTQSVGTSSSPQSITVYNDPNDPNRGPLTFTSIAVNGLDYAQTNNCGTLTPGRACSITVTFTPAGTGLRQGTIQVVTPLGSVATIFLRGQGK